MLELLSPAGSPEHLRAAVENGADAVYLGCGDFNARRRARNFTPQELEEAVKYCHVRGVKVYLTLNTLVTGRELPAAVETAGLADRMGVDGVLVQDLGLCAQLREAFPDLPLHASTQMSVHSLSGVEVCAGLGMRRVVLSRELDREAIAAICEKSPVEIEIFGHGALCMCYSGQCAMSALIGTRSGNRGLCAQPCRLPYGGGHPLSLKDMSLAGHLRELSEMGVACLKLEGRMKRPEYVAIVTRIYARAIREGREPTREELGELAAAFSRSGFTDGYFTGKTGPEMFGTRQEAAPDEALFARARESYQKTCQRVEVAFSARLEAGRPVACTLSDGEGHMLTKTGAVPEAARNRAVTAGDVEEQLSKTGGTPYRVTQVEAQVEPGLALPKAELNGLRRALLEELTRLREAPPARRRGAAAPLPPAPAGEGETGLSFSLRRAEQLTPRLWRLGPVCIDLPPAELLRADGAVREAMAEGVRFRASLPRILWDKERPALERTLEAVRGMGVSDALVPTWDLLPAAKALGFALWGDWSLGVYNPRTVLELKELGFAGAALSFELKMAAIRDFAKYLPCEAVVYGRLPLMYLQQFPGGRQTGELVDRTGAMFPVLPAPGGRAELFNSQKLYLADKEDWRRCGLWAGRMLFTAETPEECVKAAEDYGRLAPPPKTGFTRGLYYRDVE